VRAKVRGDADRPSALLSRSNRGCRSQLIDDDGAAAVAAVNWTESDLKILGSNGAGQARPVYLSFVQSSNDSFFLFLLVLTAGLPAPRPREGPARRRPRGEA